MPSSPVLKLFSKLALFLLPAVVLLAWYLPFATSPYEVQSSILQDKIERIVRAENSQVIIGGESRALYSVVPAIFTRATGLPTANIAVGGGILSEMYGALDRNALLNSRTLIIMSVSSYQINDGFADNFPSYRKVSEEEPFGVQKIADAAAYYDALLPSYFYDFKKFLKRSARDSLRIDAATLANKGYMESSGIFNPGAMGKVNDNPWYADVRTGGTRERDFLQALKKFGETDSTVVIYTGPFAPAWKKSMSGSRGAAVESHFAQAIRDAIAPYPNLHYLDFQFADIPGLTDAEFGDNTHLNKKGAPIFTAYLADALRAQKILR